jgi:hypothetical protein
MRVLVHSDHPIPSVASCADTPINGNGTPLGAFLVISSANFESLRLDTPVTEIKCDEQTNDNHVFCAPNICHTVAVIYKIALIVVGFKRDTALLDNNFR